MQDNGSSTILADRNVGTVAANGGLIRMRAHLTGSSPILMNAMSEAQLLAIRDKKKSAKNAAKPTLRDEAQSKLHLLSDGTPHMPTNALYKCWINAGAFIRLDAKRQISNAKATVLPGMLSLEDHHLPLYVPGKDTHPHWEIDIQRGRNPGGGEAVCIVRPRFDEWEVRCTVEIDQQQMPVSMAYDLIATAGKRIGLLDGRPQCKGTFGRYAITLWEEAEAV